MGLATHVLQALAVLGAAIAVLGFLRLRSAFDRLHCVTFALVAIGVPLLGAALCADGLTTRVLKLVALIGGGLIGGAVLNQAVSRACLYREKVQERP